MSKTALIAGATGLIGSHVLELLLKSNNYNLVLSLSRKSTTLKHEKLKEIITSFDQLEEVSSSLIADDVFICLGSTMKKAGSKEAFELYDYTYPLQIIEFALANGASQLSLISALGANSQSKFFYNKIKGNLEEAILDLRYDSVNILQPSLLIGNRNETRVGESIAKWFYKAIGWAFFGSAKKYKAINGKTVAKAMVHIALENNPGINIFDSAEIAAKA